MVNMNPIIAVICLAVAAQATLPEHMHDYLKHPGKQYQLYKELSDSLELPANAHTDALAGLNIDRTDKVVNDKDLGLYYWDKDVKFAIPRFLKMFDDNADNQIHDTELLNDMKKKEIKVALVECRYLLSPGLRQSCYADQLLTYAVLVLGENDIKKFYESIDTNKKDGITKDELDKAVDTSKTLDKKYKGKESKEMLAEELGLHDDKKVSDAEFREYVTQESVNDDFRVCRKPIETTNNLPDFENDCLLDELVIHTNDDLTELDISVLFRAVDKDGKNGISEKEIGDLVGSEGASKLSKIMELLDMSATTPKGGARTIDYGEFRTYLMSPTVLIQMERRCIEPKEKQSEEIECIYHLLKSLIIDEHDTIWLVVPDLDQTIAFEILDTSNDGKIKKEELGFANAEAKERFLKEADDNKNQYICLEEFNEYVDIPHMVYGTADCLLESRKTPDKRKGCFTKEIEDIIDNIKYIESEAWSSWFKFYDESKDGVIESTDNLKKHLGSDELAKLFLLELGQGGESVTHFEFEWYAKQQELADKYEKEAGINAIIKSFDATVIQKLHNILKKWIEEDVTEYDIQQFFATLDQVDASGKKNHELTESDFGEAWATVKPLIEKIDKVEPEGDQDSTVNFREFWLWLHSTKADGSVKIKSIFKQDCTVKLTSQQQEIDCYVNTFKEASKFL